MAEGVRLPTAPEQHRLVGVQRVEETEEERMAREATPTLLTSCTLMAPPVIDEL